jgi:hypothetical protein
MSGYHILIDENSDGTDESIVIIYWTSYSKLYCLFDLIYPKYQDVITGTQSNFETSGGFGPNQVATFLGLGMFVFFSRIILESRSKFMLILNLIIALNISYRGIVTFLEAG